MYRITRVCVHVFLVNVSDCVWYEDSRGGGGGTFEEFDSFAVDDANSVFEFRVVAQELCKCNALWTWRRCSLCSCLLRHFSLCILLFLRDRSVFLLFAGLEIIFSFPRNVSP